MCIRDSFTTKELVATGTATGLDEGKSILVPSLVEVWRTAPYLHDGRAKTCLLYTSRWV